LPACTFQNITYTGFFDVADTFGRPIMERAVSAPFEARLAGANLRLGLK
jgi:hypothetical protein